MQPRSCLHWPVEMCCEPEKDGCIHCDDNGEIVRAGIDSPDRELVS